MGVSSPIKRYVKSVIDPDVRVHQRFGSRIVAQSFDTAFLNTLTNPTDGQIRCSRIDVPQPMLITGVVFFLPTLGVYTANNNNKVAMYSAGGTPVRLAQSADTPTMWSAAGTNSFKFIPFSSPYAAPAGIYLAALLWNHDETNQPGGFAVPAIGCRAPTLGAPTSSIDYTTGKSYGVQGGQTDMPATLAAFTASSTMPWMSFYT